MTDNKHDSSIKALLAGAKTIAVVGLSPKEQRPSNQVARYLIEAGYQVIAVNPGHHTILGRPCFPNLAAIPEHIDIVDIFRKPADVPAVVTEAIAVGAGAVWLQQGIVHQEACRQASAAGLVCIMDRCIKIEHQRLLIEPATRIA